VKAPFVEVTFRAGKPVAAYVRLATIRRGEVAETRKVTPSLLVDYGAAGEALGIEILAFDGATVARINEILVSVGHAPLADHELAPLRAA
jgi:uncharacterized protein YuzE